MDIADGLLTLAVGGLAYLFVAALIDHWVIPGGLGFTGRLTLFLILMLASAGYFVWRVLPLLIHRINPLFAAYTIEQSRPSLKNSLINLLFLRGQRTQIERDVLSHRIYQGLERTAAADLSRVSADAAVDHAPVIRRGYLLAGIVAIAALYLALSPKNPLTSFGRVVFPWAGIRPPTRVTIDRVEPGDSVVYQGDYVTLSAEVHGLDTDESVLLYYTTVDGQSVNQAVPMTLSDGDYRHRCQLPPGPLGMQQETVYHLVAGDCTTRPYRLEVQPALSIRVDSVDYHYPEYTGLGDRSVERQGDVRAIEGTQVTVHATASHPIQQATIEMDCKPEFGQRMRSSETTATGQFTLAMSRDNPGRPQHASYQVRFRDPEGHEDRRPTRYRIEVIPDLPPDVRLIEPPPDGAQFPVDGVLPFRVRAEDPDFALRSVALRMEVDGKGLPIRPLLNKLRPDKAQQGPFEAVYRFQPAKLGLKAGDKVVYLAEAVDNKEPVGNRTKTQQRTLLLVPPQSQKSPQDRSEEGGQDAGRPGNPARQGDRSNQADQMPQDRGQESEKSPDSKQQSDPTQDPQAKSGQQQSDEPRPKDDSTPPNAQNQNQNQDQSSQPGQQGGQQNQGGQGKKGEQSSAGNTQGQSGESEGKQDQTSSQQSSQANQGQQSQSGANQGESQQGTSSATSGQDAQQHPGGEAGNRAETPQQPVDGQSNPGDVFEKALERRAEQEKKNGQQAAGSERQESGEQQGADGKQQGADGKQQGEDGKQQGADGKPQGGEGKQQGTAGKPQGAEGKQQNADGKQQGGEGKPDSSPSATEPTPNDAQSGGEPGAKGGDRQAKQGQSQQPPGAESQTGDTPRGQGQTQRMPDSEGAAKKPGPDDKPEPGQGMQSKGAGQPDKDQQHSPSASGEKRPDQRGGDREGSTGSPGAGRPAQENRATPSPQEDNHERPKNANPSDQKPSESQDSATSPSVSPKSSDSQGDMGGDRSGGGEQGGGQASKQSGMGTAGSHSAAEQGGERSEQQGQGETGAKAGDQVKADRRTGQSAAEGKGPGSGQKADGSKQPATGNGDQSAESRQSPDTGRQPDANDKSAPSPPSTQPASPTEPAPPGSRQSEGAKPSAGNGQPGAGNPTGGGLPGPQPDVTKPPPAVERPGDPYNREFAEKQTTLALEYLKDQLAKEKPDQTLLDQLGWNRQDLAKFVTRWESMRRAAAEPGPSGDAAKKQFGEALKSLGLRPGGTVLRGGQTSRDRMRNLNEPGRFDPPPEWSELLRAYNRGVAGGK